ncbi:hypothetical protein FACS1894184_13440 [Clostridia bacterium]|nr:hypothetical protein FACS1894184_13440 [Clostridia bacterium]
MLINNNGYFQVLESVKAAINNAQYKAVLGVNREQILLFWNIGKVIIDGSSFIENLARDIKLDFPDAKGYSVRNLRYMRKFAELFGDIENLQVPLADLTWYHHQALMDKTADKERYIWYAAKTLEDGWSKNILVHQIEYKLYERQVLADKATNFERTLTPTNSELVRDTLKDPDNTTK